MLVSAVGSYPVFRTVTEENRKPPVESPAPVCKPHPHHHSGINPVSVTGWLGAGALAAAVGSAKHMPTLHKISAFVGVASVAAHIGMINASRQFYKSLNKEECLNEKVS